MRAVRRRVVTAVVGVGVLLSVLFLSPVELILLFVLSGAVAGTLRYAYTDGDARLGEISRYAAAAGMIVIATVAYGQATGHVLLTILLVGVVLGARPVLCARHPTPAAVPDAGLSDQELGAAWRRSYVLLERVTSPEERGPLVLLRQSYLDEFERRHPLTFAKWLETEPKATGDLTNYFAPHDP